MQPLAHFKTITHHRHLVCRYCFRLGLYRQGLLHDLSKYAPCEFWRGAKYYQGYRSPNDAERKQNGVSLAWLHHKGRNRHHFEYWIDYCIGEDGKPYMGGCKMPLRYVAEMFCDRIAACRTYLKDKYTDAAPYDYYIRSKSHILIHPETSDAIEAMLRVLRDEMKIIEKFWSDLNEIFVAEVLLTGGNPFRNFDIIKSIVNVINLRRQKPQIFIVCNEDLSLKNIEFLQKYNITLVINLVKSDEIYLNKMETFIKLLQNYGVKYVLYKRVNVERFEFASQSRLISDIVRKNETIVSKDNIVRNSSLNVNSLIGLKNICTLGKVLLHINGKLSVCKEYQGEENNVLSQNAINTTLTFEEVWNKAFPTEKCQSCNLKKICVNCPGILEKYSNYSNFV